MKRSASKSTQTRKERRDVTLPVTTWDRLEFLRTEFGWERDETVSKVVRFFDLIVPTMRIEGAKLYLEHRDGTRERIEL